MRIPSKYMHIQGIANSDTLEPDLLQHGRPAI